jgi:hypothetical protein
VLEDDMASAGLPHIHPIRASNRLQAADTPVARVLPHPIKVLKPVYIRAFVRLIDAVRASDE